MAGRPMKYPYTFTAKMMQFPMKYYMKHNWLYRYLVYGTLASFPVFVWINSKVNSPAAIARYEESKRKQAAAEHHH